MASPLLAIMPGYDTNIDEVTLVDGTHQNDTFGGFLSTVSPGGRLIQCPGLDLPMLWHRGSMFNLGQWTTPSFNGATLPTLGAQQFDASGTNQIYYWWDAPNSWGGYSNYLIRRPRTLIVIDKDQIFGYPATDLIDWVNANIAEFQTYNLSVATFTGQPGANHSYLASGIPFNTSNFLTTPLSNPNIELNYSMPTTNPQQYLGGDCYVAVLMADIFGLGFNGADYLATTGIIRAGDPPPAAHPFTLFNASHTGGSPPATNYYGAYLNFAKATNDLSVLAVGAARFNSFALKLYQYDSNLTDYTNDASPLSGAIYEPNPIIPDDQADRLIAPGGALVSRQTFAVDDTATMLDALLTDVAQFFG